MELIAAVCHMLVKYYVYGVANRHDYYTEDIVYIVIYEFIYAVG